MEINDKGIHLEKHAGKYVAIGSHSVFVSKPIQNEYNILNIADFHGLSNFPISLLYVLREYLMSRKGKIDLIVITGDIDSGISLSRKDSLIITKTILEDFSRITGNIPIYIVPGNHELGIAVKYNKDKIFDFFRNLKSGNIFPLISEKESYRELDITGFAFGREYYKQSDVDGINALLLEEYLNNIDMDINSNNVNIGLIHDCWAVYFSKYLSESKIKDFDLLLSGHSHGGYVPTKVLLDKATNDNSYSYGLVEYFASNGGFLRIPGCYGLHEIGDNTCLSVTEGIRRFNGYLPKGVYTIPFVTEVNVAKKLSLKKEEK